MRVGGGKQKGAEFEREICKLLSLWLTQGKSEDTLWRSAMSGGRATIAHRKGKNVRVCGDICAVAHEAHYFCNKFFVEIKHVKKLALDQFLIKGTGPLANFWQVAKREALKHKRLPMIIARQNGWPTIVLIIRGTELEFLTPLIQTEEVEIFLFDKWMSCTDTGQDEANKII